MTDRRPECHDHGFCVNVDGVWVYAEMTEEFATAREAVCAMMNAVHLIKDAFYRWECDGRWEELEAL